MQEQFPRQQSRHGAICGDKARLHIKLDPQTMELMVPLHWEVNKLKCYLNYLIPKFEFGMMRLEHDGQELPGMSTFQKVLAMDQDEQCMTRGAFAVRIILVKDTSSFEFQKYYAHKILPLMSSMRNSPYEPILNPHYSGLLSELNHLRKIDGSNGRPNFQELINLRNLIARNRPLGEGAGNQDANQQVEQLENMEGAGVFGPRPAANGNIFERGGYFIFKLLQILLLWQLIQVIYNHISAAHILILVVIIATYFCIDHFQKARKAQNPADPNPQPQQQPQLSDESSEQASGNGPVGSSRQQQVLDQVKADVLNSRMPSWVVSIFQFFCLLFEVVVSFSMSMFPNWSIQLHNRMLQRTFDSVDHILQQWQRPSQAKVEREQSEEFGQEASEEDEAVRVEQPSGEE